MSTAAIREILEPGFISLNRDRVLELENRPLVMGVLNITPDSFSDGGRWLDTARAVERAQSMVADGAEILDLGAESTRPGGGVYGAGAVEVSAEEELNRLLPVLQAVRERVSIPISVDTRKGSVAKAALAAGADFVNDVSALADPAMPRVIVESGCSVVVMHSRGKLASMQADIEFDDVVHDVVADLEEIVARALRQGIDRCKIIVDPGIGFGKRVSENLQLLRRLEALHELRLPILVGASRKSFIGALVDAPPERRLAGSLAAVGWVARCGASIVRVHDVAETAQFLAISRAIESVRGIDS